MFLGELQEIASHVDHAIRIIQHDQAAAGEEILIARAGKPIARLVALETDSDKPRVLGQGKGRFSLPENFSQLHQDAIQRMFESGE